MSRLVFVVLFIALIAGGCALNVKSTPADKAVPDQMQNSEKCVQCKAAVVLLEGAISHPNLAAKADELCDTVFVGTTPTIKIDGRMRSKSCELVHQAIKQTGDKINNKIHHLSAIDICTVVKLCQKENDYDPSPDHVANAPGSQLRFQSMRARSMRQQAGHGMTASQELRMTLARKD